MDKFNDLHSKVKKDFWKMLDDPDKEINPGWHHLLGAFDLIKRDLK